MVSFHWQSNLEKSCRCTHVLSITSNESQVDPSSRANPAMLSPLHIGRWHSMTTSLSSSEEEEFVLAVQPTTSQPVGTQSGRQHLWQYDQILDEIQQPTKLGMMHLGFGTYLATRQREAKGSLVWQSLEEEPFSRTQYPLSLRYIGILPISL